MSHNLLFLGHGLFFIWSLVIDKITVENLYLRILIEEAGHFGQAMVDFYLRPVPRAYVLCRVQGSYPDGRISLKLYRQVN